MSPFAWGGVISIRWAGDDGEAEAETGGGWISIGMVGKRGTASRRVVLAAALEVGHAGAFDFAGGRLTPRFGTAEKWSDQASPRLEICGESSGWEAIDPLTQQVV